MPRDKKIEPSVTEPISLDDLRWLVQQCEGLDGKSRVSVKGRVTESVREVYPGSITVNGKETPPNE